jgi:hypothetical protein
MGPVYLASGNPKKTIFFGSNPVNTMTVSCPVTVPHCTLALSVMDNICATTKPEEIVSFALIVSVDGTPIDDGSQASVGWGRCQGANWIGNYAVGPGGHQVTLTTYIYKSFTDYATQDQWSVNYAVTIP